METVRTKSMTQRTGWKAVFWGFLAAALEALVAALTGWQAPEALRPWIPVVAAGLRFWIEHIRTSDVDTEEIAAHAPTVTVVDPKGKEILT
jgi:hypothetical protein